MSLKIFERRHMRDAFVTVIGATLLALAISVAVSMPAIYRLPTEYQSGPLTVAVLAPIVCCLFCSSPMVALRYRITMMRDEMARAAITDVLTGINNRRGFFEKAKAILAEADTQRYDAFIIDLDLFKRINDGYGHDVGDKVLAAVGGALAELLTEREVVGRTGGDEFVVLAQWNIERRSAAISEAIRKQIMALQIPVDDRILAVTASIGYSTVRSEADLNAALTRADSALYRAKERGRNRVEAALVAA